MKRCAKCDKEYDDSYDDCPHCAKAANWNKIVIIFVASMIATFLIGKLLNAAGIAW